MAKAFVDLMDKVTIFDSPKKATEAIEERLSNSETLTVGFVNAHAFNLAKQERDFYQSLQDLDVVLRDGIGVKIYCKYLGIEPGYNLNGTDYIPYLISAIGSGKKMAVLGTTLCTIDSAMPALDATGAETVVKADGFQTVDYYVDLVKNNPKLDIILLAMGMPKQELVAHAIKPYCNGAVIICGGAIVDFMGGRVERAPEIMRMLGLEWCYRLLKEPKRLFKRYVIGNVKFLLTMLNSKKEKYENA
ncbi:WecB/TagA/CpsF family glycosyltransferase [Vibrio fluminensis]|uniref:WecB/TagA/CpsF family glycosyltransferase n=1 Tax=Vibrio fluminensis TaxID=2783614 RepID=UPI0018871443|nr:WecB/TagA/CpsF family glycosyltransferase [Vibrio fluminensis]